MHLDVCKDWKYTGPAQERWKHAIVVVCEVRHRSYSRSIVGMTPKPSIFDTENL